MTALNQSRSAGLNDQEIAAVLQNDKFKSLPKSFRDELEKSIQVRMPRYRASTHHSYYVGHSSKRDYEERMYRVKTIVRPLPFIPHVSFDVPATSGQIDILTKLNLETSSPGHEVTFIDTSSDPHHAEGILAINPSISSLEYETNILLDYTRPGRWDHAREYHQDHLVIPIRNPAQHTKFFLWTEPQLRNIRVIPREGTKNWKLQKDRYGAKGEQPYYGEPEERLCSNNHFNIYFAGKKPPRKPLIDTLSAIFHR